MDVKHIRTARQFEDDTFILNDWLGRSEEDRDFLIGVMARSGQPLTKKDISDFEDLSSVVESLRMGGCFKMGGCFRMGGC